MTARRASTVAVASVVATALLVVLLVTWASSIGPSGVLRGTGPSPAGTPTVTASSASPSEDAVEPRPEQEERPRPAWLRTLAVLVDAAVAVAGVLLLLSLARTGVRGWRVRRYRRRRLAAADEVEFDVIEPPVAVAREILAGAAEQRQALLEGDPRNAVVACWHRFETGAAAAGLERRVWETSSEFTLRILDLVDAHEPAVSRLAALYREARFSEHDLTEADRQDALEALDTIHRTIGVGV
jgi:hypothetical protein